MRQHESLKKVILVIQNDRLFVTASRLSASALGGSRDEALASSLCGCRLVLLCAWPCVEQAGLTLGILDRRFFARELVG